MSRLPFSPRVLLLSTALALIAAIATYVVLAPSTDDSTKDKDAIQLDPGQIQPVTEVSYTTFDGKQVPLVASHEGTPLVVNFFSSTCVPCIKEMPALEEVHQELGDQVAMLGLAVADRGEAASKFVDQTGVTYDTARDPDGAVIASLGGTILPTTVILDADGQIVGTHTGALTADELRELLHDDLGLSVS
jgi:thiol-disulfide isomerase/thioredoxin